MLKRKLLENDNTDDKENLNPVEQNQKKIKKDVVEEMNEIIVVESDSDEEEDESSNESSEDEYESKCGTIASVKNKFSPEFNKKVRKLNEYLQEVKGCGDYSVEGRANELPTMLGLEIKDFGSICLPFIDPQASKLIEICEQAPFGRNEQTLVDKTVRDSYQLQPSAIRITNPEWNVKLKELVARVAKGLGCLSEIEARLYKLLVYKSGGHFLKHRDTEKEEGMFGTLVIQLPSRYEGGELVVYESGNKSKRVIDFGQKEGLNEFAIHFAAHYADLEHELLEVKSGYRLVLVYSLCWLNGNQSYIYSGPLKQKVHTCLEAMNTVPYNMAIILNHKYTELAMGHSGVNALKSKDHDRYNLLKSVSEHFSSTDKTKQLEFYICQVEMEVEEDSEYIDNTRTMEIIKWLDCTGKEITFEGAKTNMDIFDLVLNPFTTSSTSRSDGKKRSIDYRKSKYWEFVRKIEPEYTGNEEMNATKIYKKFILVAFCKFSIDEFKFNSMLCCKNYTGLVNYIFKKAMSTATIDEEFLAKFNLILERLENDRSYSGFRIHLENSDWMNIIQILDKIGDITLILGFVNKFMEHIEIQKFSNFIANWLIKYGFENIMPSLSKLVKPISDNLTKNCLITKALFDENDIQLSLKYLNEKVLPIMNDKTEFEKVIENSLSEHSYEWYKKGDVYDLAKTILLFENQEESMQNYKDRIIELSKAESIKHLISKFLKEPTVFKSLPSIRTLCEYRRKWVEDTITHLEQTKQEFSWQMTNARMPEYPKVEKFLRSEQTHMNLFGVFSGIADARRFADSYNGRFNNGFSIKSVANGIGRNAYVSITKTRGYYDTQVNFFKKLEQELQDINNFLN